MPLGANEDSQPSRMSPPARPVRPDPSSAHRAGAAARDAAADAGRSVKSVIAGLRPGSEEPGPAQRLARLLDDARDGDPRSLAVVTGAAMALAGLSVAALVKAVRS